MTQQNLSNYYNNKQRNSDDTYAKTPQINSIGIETASQQQFWSSTHVHFYYPYGYTDRTVRLPTVQKQFERSAIGMQKQNHEYIQYSILYIYYFQNHRILFFVSMDQLEYFQVLNHDGQYSFYEDNEELVFFIGRQSNRIPSNNWKHINLISFH